MPSKLTFHISGFRHEPTFDWVAKSQVKLLKVQDYDSDTNLQRFIRETGALIVYRPGYGEGDNDPATLSVGRALGVIDRCRAKAEWPRGIVWEGLNEPDFQTVAQAMTLNSWYVAFANELHARGEKVAGFSLSTGNPTPDKLPLLAYCRDALGACDYLALHDYSANFGYYRHIWNALPVKKPILITETGFDIAGDALDGWQKHLKKDEYLELLKSYDRMLLEDPYVLGACIFQLGNVYRWRWFDIVEIMPQLADYIAGQGGGYPPVWNPGPVTPPTPPPVSTGWYPGAVRRPVKNFAAGRSGKAMTAIVLHVADGPLSALYPTFNGAAQVSAHFGVGKNGEIEQYVSIADTAWANGLRYSNGVWFNPRGVPVKPTWTGLQAGINPNLHTISIECEGTPTDTWTPAMADASRKLLAWLAAECKLALTPHISLIGHNEIDPVDRANDPGPLITKGLLTVEPELSLVETVRAVAGSRTWMPINSTAALWKYAKAHNLEDAQTDEIRFGWGGGTYICQVFNRGIVYCKQGEWDRISVIAK